MFQDVYCTYSIIVKNKSLIVNEIDLAGRESIGAINLFLFISTQKCDASMQDLQSCM